MRECSGMSLEPSPQGAALGRSRKPIQMLALDDERSQSIRGPHLVFFTPCKKTASPGPIGSSTPLAPLTSPDPSSTARICGIVAGCRLEPATRLKSERSPLGRAPLPRTAMSAERPKHDRVDRHAARRRPRREAEPFHDFLLDRLVEGKHLKERPGGDTLPARATSPSASEAMNSAPPAIRSSSSRRSTSSSSSSRVCVGSPATFSTRKCRSATLAICGRWVIVNT